jgi:hypothetical protein
MPRGVNRCIIMHHIGSRIWLTGTTERSLVDRSVWLRPVLKKIRASALLCGCETLSFSASNTASKICQNIASIELGLMPPLVSHAMCLRKHCLSIMTFDTLHDLHRRPDWTEVISYYMVIPDDSYGLVQHAIPLHRDLSNLWPTRV